MFIEKFSNNGIDYLRLCESYRPKDSKRATRKVICNLGSLAKLSDGKPNFLERLRDSFRNGQALIPELQPYVTDSPKPSDSTETVLLPFPIKGETPDGTFITKHFSDSILNAYISELGLAQLFRTIKSNHKIQYDLLGFVKLAVYGRILEPQSKWASVQQKDKYYTPILKPDYNPYNMYDMLDLVYENQLSIFRTIDKALQKRIDGRDVSIVFYDVTNFFFEIEQNDPDILGEDGVIIEEGLRKRGHSKESRPQPIVQMGLFMDKDGVPIGIKTFSGNTVDKSTLITATSEVIGPMKYQRFIYCADRGLCTMANLVYLLSNGMGYLLSKSIKQSSKEDRDWIIDPEDYESETNENGEVVFKWKSAIKDRTHKRDDGTDYAFKEKVVVFWSLEYYKREKHMMENFSNFLDKLEKSTKSFTLNASQIKNIHRFLKTEVLDSLDPENDTNEEENNATLDEVVSDAAGKKADKETESKEKTEQSATQPENGSDSDTSSDSQSKENKSKGKRKRLTQEEKDQRAAEKKAEAARIKALKDARKKRLTEQLKSSENAKAMIDWDKVYRWRDYAGYYQIVTSELDTDEMTVINTYRKLTQIENRFRTMKSTLNTRPIYLQTAEHIEAHLVLCTMALIIIALIQGKVKKKIDAENCVHKKWCTGMNPDRIQSALNAFSLEPMPNNYVRFRSRTLDQAGKDLDTILQAYGLPIQSRLYTPGELRAFRGTVKVL